MGMISVRRAGERGHENYGWLDTQHTFSFGEYHDPRHMGFRALRVINEDRVKPESGFGTHSHRDMEIVSYVLDGELGHKDSMGTGSVIRPGDVQRMSAGTGVTHSEWNHSKTEFVHFLQIWILPDRRGIEPGYEQKTLAPESMHNQLRLIASPDGRDGAVTVHQDAEILRRAARRGPARSRMRCAPSATPGFRWRAARSTSTARRWPPATARRSARRRSVAIRASEAGRSSPVRPRLTDGRRAVPRRAQAPRAG